MQAWSTTYTFQDSTYLFGLGHTATSWECVSKILNRYLD